MLPIGWKTRDVSGVTHYIDRENNDTGPVHPHGDVPQYAADLFEKMLTPLDPRERLTFFQNDIIFHPYFEGINWKQLGLPKDFYGND